MKKSKSSGIRSLLTRRQFRYGWYSVGLTLLVIAVLVVVNIMVGAAESKWALKIDASPNSITAFTDQTYDTLAALSEDIHIYLLFQKGNNDQLRNQLEEVAAKYRALSAHISVDVIDPISEPGRVNQYKSETSNASLGHGSVIVTNSDETRVKLISASEMYGRTLDQQTMQYVTTSFNAESKLTQAIMYVTNEDTPMVYLLQGHDELSIASCSTLASLLASENYEFKELTLTEDTPIKAGDTLLIAAPQIDMTAAEYEQLKTFLDGGGRMLFAADPSMDTTKLPNFVKLLDYYAIRLKDGMVVEDQNSADSWRLMPTVVVPKLNAEHQITKDLAGATFMLYAPRAVEKSEMPLSGFGYDEILTSSAKSYIKSIDSQTDVLIRDPEDEVGSQVLALTAIRQPDMSDPLKDTRILVAGSLYLIADSEFTNSSHNIYFAMSAFNWLVNRNATVYIRNKSVADTMLSIPNQSTYLMLMAVAVFVIPGFILICGIWVFLKRRRL